MKLLKLDYDVADLYEDIVFKNACKQELGIDRHDGIFIEDVWWEMTEGLQSSRPRCTMWLKSSRDLGGIGVKAREP